MRLRDMITTAGGGRANEDRAGQRGNLAWVIDGATDLYEDAALPAERDVHWLVDLVAERLGEAGAEGYRGSATTLLEDVAERVCQEQAALRFPAGRLPPAGSIAIAVDQGVTYQIARVGDATAVVTGGEGLKVLATDFFDRREGAAVRDQRHGATANEVRTAMLKRRRQTMTAGDLESVFSGHRQRRLRPHTLTGDWTGVEQILLCTDGFARLVSDYTRYQGWGEVVADARIHGLVHLEKVLRDLERDSSAGDPPNRFKRSDDVAAVLLSPEPT